MRLWIIRHGKAHPHSGTGRDEDRELAPRGLDQARWLGAELADPVVAPHLVLSSPLPRALATARLIADAVGCELAVRRELSTAHGLESHAALLRGEWAGESRPVLAIVGHNPTLSDLGRWLVGGTLPELRTGEAWLLAPLNGAVPGEPGTMRLLRAERLAGE
jgi:phosphohistidine phosphatase